MIRIVIDSGPAEAGASRVVRSLEAIRGKSVEAVAGIGNVEDSLRRLKELEKSATTSLGGLMDKSGPQ